MKISSRLPPLSLTALIDAGGLQTEILGGPDFPEVAWVYPIQLPPPEWLPAGAAVVVSGGKSDCRALRDNLDFLATSGVAGVVVAGPGRPAPMLRDLDPPILLAWAHGSAPEVAERLGRAVAEIESHVLGARLHEALGELSLGGDFSPIARALGEVLRRPLALEDINYRILGSWTGEHEVDEVWKISLREGKPPASVLQTLDRSGYLRRMRTTRTPLRIRGVPELGMKDRIVAPIKVGGQLYGFLTILEDHPLAAGLATAQHLATIAALHFAELHAIVETEKRLRGTFVEELLVGTRSPVARESLLERAEIFGLDLDLPYAVAIIDLRRSDGRSAGSDHRDAFVSSLERYFESQPSGSVYRVLGDQVVALLPVPGDDDMDSLKPELEAISAAMDEQFPRLRCFAGCGTASVGVHSIRESYREAREALGFADQEHPMVFYSDARRLRLVGRVSSSQDLAIFRKDVLGPLAEPADPHTSQIKETLELLARSDFRRVEAAQKLFVHRNTLRRRIGQIEELTGLDLTSPGDQALIQLAFDAELVLRERLHEPVR
jgi:PucR family transcriptional regulator, purine catabolism regulatory protein